MRILLFPPILNFCLHRRSLLIFIGTELWLMKLISFEMKKHTSILPCAASNPHTSGASQVITKSRLNPTGTPISNFQSDLDSLRKFLGVKSSNPQEYFLRRDFKTIDSSGKKIVQMPGIRLRPFSLTYRTSNHSNTCHFVRNRKTDLQSD